MTESIVVQVGQCGNQVGSRFWDGILHEQAARNKDGTMTDSLSTFFRNLDGRSDQSLPIGSRLKHLKARAVLIDMENRVVDRILQGPLRDIFDKSLTLTDSCGSGNNWATGHVVYGVQHSDRISELVRRSSEACDNLQSFSILHSMGGGTGSGLGTAILKLLSDEYAKTSRFVTCVFPADQDDVITSAYNSTLAMKVLAEDADYILSVDNEALSSICSKSPVLPRLPGKSQTVPIDLMNDLVARTLVDLTSSSRFDGCLNLDLNEIPTNMVPYPRMKFLIPGLSPVSATASRTDLKKIDRMFYDTFTRPNQLMDCDPKSSVYLACLLLARGKDVTVSEIRGNIEKTMRHIRFVRWNPDGWKVGICEVPSLSHPRSLLSLANNGCFYRPLERLRTRFSSMYRGKAHVHHYLANGLEMTDFDESLESVSSLIFDYKQLDGSLLNATTIPPRMRMDGGSDRGTMPAYRQL